MTSARSRGPTGPSAQLQLDFHFEFDVALAPEALSTEIPAGYNLGAREE